MYNNIYLYMYFTICHRDFFSRWFQDVSRLKSPGITGIMKLDIRHCCCAGIRTNGRTIMRLPITDVAILAIRGRELRKNTHLNAAVSQRYDIDLMHDLQPGDLSNIF